MVLVFQGRIMLIKRNPDITPRFIKRSVEGKEVTRVRMNDKTAKITCSVMKD